MSAKLKAALGSLGLGMTRFQWFVALGLVLFYGAVYGLLQLVSAVFAWWIS